MIFPCPGLPAPFLPFTEPTAGAFGFGTGAMGSSSEKDSQTASSLVTTLN